MFKKRAKDIKYLNISIDDVLKSDKITDNDMKKCLGEKYKIPQFKNYYSRQVIKYYMNNQ